MSESEEPAEFETLIRADPSQRAARLAQIRAQDPAHAARLQELLDNDPGHPDDDPPLPAILGQELPGYELLREIGRGTSGIVYEARDPSLDRLVAIKFLDPTNGAFSDSEGAARRFERESQLLARLEHPGIPPIFGSGEDANGRPFIVMRRVTGRHLGEVLGELPGVRGRAELVEVVLQIARMCEVVHSAHRLGAVHRDLKPSHVSIDDHNVVNVLDWGLATLRWVPPDRSEVEQSIASSLEWSKLSQVGQVLGNASYMAPEQASKDPLPSTPQVDVWAIGAMLHEAVWAVPVVGLDQGPPTGIEDLLQRVRSARCRFDPDELPTGVVELGRIVARALERDPNERYPSAGELGADLRSWLITGARIGAESPGPRPRSRRALALGAAALLLLGALGGSWWRTSFARAPNPLELQPSAPPNSPYSFYATLINNGALSWTGDTPMDLELLHSTLDSLPRTMPHGGSVWLKLAKGASNAALEDSMRSYWSDAALEECELMLLRGPGNRNSVNLLAPALFHATFDLVIEGELDQLEQVMHWLASATAPRSPLLQLTKRLLAERASHRDDFDGARRWMSELIVDDGIMFPVRLRVELLRHRACIELEAGLPRAAEPDLRLAASLSEAHLDPTDQLRFDVQQQLAWMETMDGRAADAVERLDRLWQQVPELEGLSGFRRCRLLELSGDACLAAGQDDRAKQFYRNGEKGYTQLIAAEFAGSIRCRTGQMRSLAAQGEFGRAIEIGRRQVEVRHQVHEQGQLAIQAARLELLTCLWKQGDREGARQLASGLNTEDPNDPHEGPRARAELEAHLAELETAEHR